MAVAYPEVTLRKRGFRRLASSHPWIFRDDVDRCEDARHGDLVRIVGMGGKGLGYAAFSARSKICLRIVTREDRAPDADFWTERLSAAIDLRRRLVPPSDNACRLVFGESDGLPGLIVDRYAGHLVIQSLTAATERLVPGWLDLLADRGDAASILARNDPRVRELEGLPREVTQLRGSTPREIEVREDDVRYLVAPWSGQKTGGFLDQRENRVTARAYCRGRVLDGFSYQGGFALHAARRGAEVVAVDSSSAALEMGRRAAELNGLEGISFRRANVFHELRRLEREKQPFDAVILDPPAFAKSRRDLAAAERAYKEINLRAMRLLGPGGILISSSCSYNLGEARFLEVMEAAAADAGRTLRLLEKRAQARDHPVRLGFPESHYLKCLVLSVM